MIDSNMSIIIKKLQVIVDNYIFFNGKYVKIPNSQIKCLAQKNYLKKMIFIEFKLIDPKNKIDWLVVTSSNIGYTPIYQSSKHSSQQIFLFPLDAFVDEGELRIKGYRRYFDKLGNFRLELIAKSETFSKYFRSGSLI